MTRSIRSALHAGGTSAPSVWKRGGPPPEIWGQRDASGVPLRATRVAGDSSASAEACGSWASAASSGTEWHDSPMGSIRVHGRAR